MTDERVLKKIMSAPEESGIYIFKNKLYQPIYIGRSVNLKERLKSYLASADPKAKALLKESFSLKIIKTSLIDSVIGEVNLIKKERPKYNIKEKDDRSFIYIEILKSDWPYPRLKRERQLREDSFKLGPFKSFKTAKDLLFLIRKVFPYSTCKEGLGRPCFHRQIFLCPGKCTGEISKKDYQKIIDDLILFLKGDKDAFKKSSPNRAKLIEMIDDSLLINRDEFLVETDKFKRIEGYDISHFGGKEQVGAMVLYRDGDFDKDGYRLFKIKKASAGDDIGSLREILERRLNRKEWKYPDLILVDGGMAQVRVFEEIVSKRDLNIDVLGISEYGGDKIVSTKKEDISPSFSNLLIRIRDEAHRFSNSFRRKRLSKKIFDKKAKKGRIEGSSFREGV